VSKQNRRKRRRELRISHSLFISSLAIALVAQPEVVKAITQPSGGEPESERQIAQGAIVTEVEVKATETGVEIILATPQVPQTFETRYGETLVIDLINTQLRGQERVFQENPTPGIASVEVVQQYTNTVRVKIVGETEVPTAQVRSSPEGVALIATTEAVAAEPDELPEDETEMEAEVPQEVEDDVETIELVVTGEQDEGYNPSRATTATQTDTPLRDIPQSIQVVPRQVIEDQQAQDIDEIVRNVSGVNLSNSAGAIAEFFNIRGFGGTVLQNGFRRGVSFELLDTTNIERVEVLKGPSSVLFGQLEPGGIINVITAEPLAEPSYSLEFQAGSYDFYRPSVDLSGPLNDDRSLRYRLNASYLNSGSFRDFTNIERYFVAPVLAWDLSESTRILLNAEFLQDTRPRDRGLVAIGTEVADIPISRRLGEPFDEDNTEQWRAGIRFEHDFNEDWSVQSNFQLTSSNIESFNTEVYGVVDETTGEIGGRFFRQQSP